MSVREEIKEVLTLQMKNLISTRECLSRVDEILDKHESQWVSVEDRLPEAMEYHPEVSVPVIAYIPKERNQGKGGEITATQFYLNIGTGRATHWTPLPTPPESKDNE